MTRGTIRLRFTFIYMALFLLSGVGLLAITVVLALGTNQQRSRPADLAHQPPPATAQQRIADLQAQLDHAHTQQFQQLLLGAAVALVVLVAVSAVLGRTVAGLALRPLGTITMAARRITADNLHHRLAVTAPDDEVKDLADTIDGLLQRLEDAFDTQRRFAANASHELRTPLATMRAAVDVAMAKPLPIPAQTIALADRVRTELDRMDHLLAGLLVLARIEQTSPSDPVTTPLAGLVSGSLDARAADLTDKALAVDRHLDDRAAVHGSRTLLTHMVDNVIDNAVTHNHHGGWIRITTATHGPYVTLVVETGGQQLDPEQVSRLAQPFHRLAADRTASTGGSGLGLSIVAAVAATHDGRLDLHARTGGGLQVTITLPRSHHAVDAPP